MGLFDTLFGKKPDDNKTETGETAAAPPKRAEPKSTSAEIAAHTISRNLKPFCVCLTAALIAFVLLSAFCGCAEPPLDSAISRDDAAPGDSESENGAGADGAFPERLRFLRIEADYVRALAVYDNFLRGEYGAWDIYGYYTPTVEGRLSDELKWAGDMPFGYHPWPYALYDMNHDGIPELHVRIGPGHYTIYTCDKETKIFYLQGPKVWADPSSTVVIPLNNGATLAHRPGTYNGVASNYYIYTLFDFFGNEQLSLRIDEYDLDGDGVLEYYLNGNIGEDGRLPNELEAEILEDVLLAKSDRIVWHDSENDYINASGLEGEYNGVNQYTVEYAPPEPGAPGLSEHLRYPVMIKGHDYEGSICPVMLTAGFGSIDDMKNSLLDDEMYDLPLLGDSDDDGAYDTLYTARKHDAPADLWYDDLLTKEEFLRAMDLLVQKATDPELLNVRVNDGTIAAYCKGGS
jgi:hypothetical protein